MRIIDWSTSFLGLLLLTPLIIIIALLVKLNSKGPAFFKQRRIGLNGIPFTCLKFRTMHIGTENRPTHEIQKSAVTKIGHILRQFKLDELPQLINVLKGDMALVGPRPCLPSQCELISAREKYGALNVTPGITGLAQINNVDMSEPLRLAKIDGLYANKRHFCGDLIILFSTFNHIIKSQTSRLSH